MCEGFCSLEVFPSPKSQVQLVGAPVLRSVNKTLNGTALTVEFVEKRLTVSRSSTKSFPL